MFGTVDPSPPPTKSDTPSCQYRLSVSAGGEILDGVDMEEETIVEEEGSTKKSGEPRNEDVG